MEPFQIYAAVYLAIFLITRFFQGDNYGDVESEEGNILGDLDIMNSALGTLGQLED
jgi:hypothetical protein